MTISESDILVIATIIFPALGVYAITGCSPDLLINIILTILGYIPGHIHAFYLLYVFYDRRDKAAKGIQLPEEEQGAFSLFAPSREMGDRIRIFESRKSEVKEE